MTSYINQFCKNILYEGDTHLLENMRFSMLASPKFLMLLSNIRYTYRQSHTLCSLIMKSLWTHSVDFAFISHFLAEVFFTFRNIHFFFPFTHIIFLARKLLQNFRMLSCCNTITTFYKNQKFKSITILDFSVIFWLKKASTEFR